MSLYSYSEILAAMYAAFEAKAGYSSDEASDLAIRMAALAAQLEEQALEIEALARQAFPATATGTFLEYHAATRGLARKEGSPARGALTFGRETAAAHDIFIPRGTVCQTTGEEPLVFATAEDATLPAGETSVTVAAASAEETPEANVAPGTVTVMVTPPQGVAWVTNGAGFFGGAAPEDDGALLARLTESFGTVSNGCNAGYYSQLALEQPGVFSVSVLPGSRGPGTVDLAVYGRGAPPSGEQLAALGERVAREREIGVDALVRAAMATTVNLTLSVAPLPGWDFPTLAEACRERVAGYAAGLRVGQPLYLSRIIGTVLEIPGVVNCKVISPAGDQHPLEDRVITLGSVAVQRMEVV